RRGYGNVYVELVRARRYLEELTAEHPDPENGIEPLRVRIRNKSDEPVRYRAPYLETVDMYIKCFVNLCQAQCADPAIPYPNGGGQFTLGIVLLMLQGEPNKSSRMNYGVVVRNKDVQICPVGALAFYLYDLWEHSERPNFKDQSWTSYHLIPGNDPKKELS
ncbi:hypothetical protein BGX26_006974, partial [Mortierella sp. AD094]